MKKEKTILRLLVALTVCLAVVVVFAVTSGGNTVKVESAPQTTTQAPETTQATTVATTQVTTQAVSQTTTQVTTTAVSESRGSSDATTTTSAVTTTQAAKTSVPSTPQEILAKYTEVVDKAKNDKPAHKKVEFQAIPEEKVNFEGGVFDKILPVASTFFVTEEKARANPEIREKGNDMYWFPPYRVQKGCMLTDVSKIKSATCTTLPDGNNKIVIVLNDEVNSEPPKEGATSCESAVGSMFSPIMREEVVYTLENDKAVKFLIKDVDFSLTYYDCTAELTYNPATNEIVALDQFMHILITINSGKVIGLSAVGTAVLDNSMFLSDFAY